MGCILQVGIYKKKKKLARHFKYFQSSEIFPFFHILDIPKSIKENINKEILIDFFTISFFRNNHKHKTITGGNNDYHW